MKKTFFLLTGVLFVLLFLGCPNATETPKSNDAGLRSLEVSEGSLSPQFDAGIFDYTVTVANSVTSLTVTGTKSHANATMTPSDGKLEFTNLSVDTPSEKTIKVTAEDGTTTENYKVKVYRQSNDATLSDLVPSTGTLSPEFDAGIFDYTVTVANSVTSLTVTGMAVANATMTPSDGYLEFANLTVDTPSEQIITVTAEDGTTTQEYKVKVVKQPSNVATLSALATNERSLTSAFNADTLEYTVIVPNSVTSLIVTGTADANATMTPSDGKLEFANLTVDTPSEQIIKVTAEDGTTTQKYKVKVTRFEELEMCRVSAGSFQRDKGEENISVITKPYSLGKYQITRKQFKVIMGEDPSDSSTVSGTTDDEKQRNPVQRVNWYHAIAFCNKLSLLEGLTPAYTVEGVSDWANLAFGDIPRSFHTDWDDAICDWESSGYRLPTEMEWMWAAMGADQDDRPGVMQDGINRTGWSKNYAGEGYGTGNSINDYAWYKENSDGKTHPVGEKLPNELELYDMSGNVMEWCWDWIDYYPNGLEEDYRGPGPGSYNSAEGTGSGSFRQSRGGSWGIDASRCSFAYRSTFDNTFFGRDYRGFRILRPVL